MLVDWLQSGAISYVFPRETARNSCSIHPPGTRDATFPTVWRQGARYSLGNTDLGVRRHHSCLGKTDMSPIKGSVRIMRVLWGITPAQGKPTCGSFGPGGSCGPPGASLLPKENQHVAYLGSLPHRMPPIWGPRPGGSGRHRAAPGPFWQFFIQWIIQRMRRVTLLHALTQQACRDFTSLPTTEIICRRHCNLPKRDSLKKSAENIPQYALTRLQPVGKYGLSGQRSKWSDFGGNTV